MLKITLKIDPKTDRPNPPARRLVLPFSERSKSRARHVLDNGEEVGLFLERGSVLRNGDLLLADDGRVVCVEAAPESVSMAHTDDLLLLARACYHLGNRHVALQVGPGWVRYQPDHVLDEMVRGLGLTVVHESARFQPERGAYHGQAHSHSHGHTDGATRTAHATRHGHHH
jgi:urease accessory protein